LRLIVTVSVNLNITKDFQLINFRHCSRKLEPLILSGEDWVDKAGEPGEHAGSVARFPLT
jgi:hypothetical protein